MASFIGKFVVTALDLQRALAGDSGALALLVSALTPVIQSRVARGLWRYQGGPAAGRDLRQEVADLSQEVFLALFAQDARALRGWDPARGLSLANFVGLVAERQVASILRSGRRNPWRDEPAELAELEALAPAEEDLPAGPERRAASREELRQLLHRLYGELSPLGRRIFELLFVEEREVEEVTVLTELSSDAVYAWRTRLRKLARRLQDEMSEPVARERTSPKERP